MMHDTDEGITVLPMDLSGVKSDANVGGNRVYSEESPRRRNSRLFDS